MTDLEEAQNGDPQKKTPADGNVGPVGENSVWWDPGWAIFSTDVQQIVCIVMIKRLHIVVEDRPTAFFPSRIFHSLMWTFQDAQKQAWVGWLGSQLGQCAMSPSPEARQPL